MIDMRLQMHKLGSKLWGREPHASNTRVEEGAKRKCGSLFGTKIK